MNPSGPPGASGTERRVTETIPEALAGERLDRAVSLAAGVSRSDAAGLVAAGAVLVDGRPVRRASQRLIAGQVLAISIEEVELTGPAPDPTVSVAAVYEDRWLAVVDKPAGLVVHPGAGTPDRTLVNGLLARYPEMTGVGEPERPGIVHRLDKGTSGLLVVARTEEAYSGLTAVLGRHEVRRVYRALVVGQVEAERGVIDAPLARSSREPTRMAVSGGGRPARTHYRVVERLTGSTLLECTLETGRTHQIRVHLAAIGHPVIGDPRYGRGQRRPDAAPVPRLDRPFLHAAELAFDHPVTAVRVEAHSALPADLEAALAARRMRGR